MCAPANDSRLRFTLRVLRSAWKDGTDDAVLLHAAALSFYTSLSLAPLLVLLFLLLRFLGPEAQEGLVRELGALLGPSGGQIVREVIQASEGTAGRTGWGGALGFFTLALGATGVFGQLQKALNRIWEIQARPGLRPLRWLRKRLLSLGTVGTAAFLLLVSLGASTVLSYLRDRSAQALPGAELALALISSAVSWAVFALMFAVVFRLLPDARVAWRDVGLGAIVTAFLFVVGKFAIGAYLGGAAVGSAYGAAGSLVVVLVWVYYSAAILLFGAEITQARARLRGRRIQPNRFALRTSAS